MTDQKATPPKCRRHQWIYDGPFARMCVRCGVLMFWGAVNDGDERWW